MKIINETPYAGRALKHIIVRAMRHELIKPNRIAEFKTLRVKVIEVCAHEHQWSVTNGLHGMYVGIPDSADTRRLALHAANLCLLWQGIDTRYYTNLEKFEWAAGFSLAKPPRVKKIVTPADKADMKIAHIERQLKNARTRLKRAQTIERKWRRKLSAVHAAIKRQPFAAEIAAKREATRQKNEAKKPVVRTVDGIVTIHIPDLELAVGL